MSVECENLDAFLVGDLSPYDNERFESHIFECDACRDSVNRQRWIDSLLQSAERFDIEPVSPALSDSTRKAIVSRRRRPRRIAWLAAAAVLVVAVGWFGLLNRHAGAPAVNHIAEAAASDIERSPNPSQKEARTTQAPRAVFVGGPQVMVAAVESRHPNVTIVRLYPIYKPTFAAQASEEPSEPSSADQFQGG